MHTRRLLASIAVAALLGGLGAAPAIAARSASPGASPPPKRAALVSPLLAIFGFGASVGVPEVCDVARGGVANATTAAGVSKQLAPVLVALAGICSQLSSNGTAFVKAFQTQVAPLAVINPVANLFINRVADLLVSVGTSQAKTIAPFGPTVATLGSTVRFFATP